MSKTIYYIDKKTGQAYTVVVHNADVSEVTLKWKDRILYTNTFELEDDFIKVESSL